MQPVVRFFLLSMSKRPRGKPPIARWRSPALPLTHRSPLINLRSHYIALLDIPGIPRNNINVTLLPASSLLRVRGEIKCSAAEEGTSFCLSRSVSHDVTLPWDADLEKGVEVGVKDGVLRIAVHRKDKTGDWKVLQVAEDTLVDS